MEVQEDVPPSQVRRRTTRVEAAAATHISSRRINADAYLTKEAAGLFAVADGMGDFTRSRRTADAVLATVSEFFGGPWVRLAASERSAADAAERLRAGLIHAHVRLQLPDLPREYRLGSTFAGAVVCHESIVVGHVGDSRAYLLRARQATLFQLTKDHTVAGQACRRGVSREHAERLPLADALTQAIGSTRTFEPTTEVWAWDTGDIALLCTDGVSNQLDASVMANLILDANDLEVAAHRIVDAAIQAGGPDNATVVLVHRRG